MNIKKVSSARVTRLVLKKSTCLAQKSKIYHYPSQSLVIIYRFENLWFKYTALRSYNPEQTFLAKKGPSSTTKYG